MKKILFRTLNEKAEVIITGFIAIGVYFFCFKIGWPVVMSLFFSGYLAGLTYGLFEKRK